MNKKLTLMFFLLTFILSRNSIAQTSNGASWIKINEVDYDQTGTDTSEFIELYNSSSSAVELGTIRVILFNGNNNTAYDTIILPTGMLNANSYFVICGNSGAVPNYNLVLPVGSNIVQNGSPDAIALWDTLSSTVIDALSYEGSCPSPYVEGIGVAPAQSDSTLDYTSIGRYPDGTDTDNNSSDFALQCITPGTANTNANTNCQSPVSVGNELRVVSALRVYPNPATDKVFVLGIPVSQSQQVARVYDVSGKLCLQQAVAAGSKGVVINVSSLHNGIYSVVLNSDNVTERKTFVVAR